MKFSLGAINFYCLQAKHDLPLVAVSACLLGEAVRYDGSDKFLATTSTMLAKHLQLLSICPEVGAGMPVPRAPVQLVSYPTGIKVLGRDDNQLDVTEALQDYRQLSLQRYGMQLSGYVFKSRSPSCGLESTPIFNHTGQQQSLGSGMQAEYFRRQLPWLPMQEETSLGDTICCEDFIVRCQLLADVRMANSEDATRQVHQHYQGLIELMAGEWQQRLHQSADGQAEQHYWQAFGQGLRTIVG